MLIKLSSRIVFPLHIAMSIFFMLGISIQIAAPLQISIIIYLSIIISLGCIFLIRRLNQEKFIVCLACISALWAGALRFYIQTYNHTTIVHHLENTIMDVIGTVINIEAKDQHEQSITINTSLMIDNQTLEKKHINTKIALCTNRMKNVSIGDVLFIKSIRFNTVSNKNFNKFLLKEGITASLFDYKPRYFIIKKAHNNLLIRCLHEFKTTLCQRIKDKMNQQTFTLFSSLFLGRKNTNSLYINKAKNSFKTLGISHFLARSGLHLILFILLWVLFLRFIPIPLKTKMGILMSIVAIYFILSWQSISFIRAFLMFFLAKLCIFLHQQISPISIFFLTSSCILIANPCYIFFLDFQLSFFLSFALIIYQQIKRSLVPILY